MINLKKIFEERAQKIMIMTEISTKKIVKKEFNKLKREIIKQLKNG